MSAREVVFIHLGQAGVQLGSAVWELFTMEHGIQPNGKLWRDDSPKSTTTTTTPTPSPERSYKQQKERKASLCTNKQFCSEPYTNSPFPSDTGDAESEPLGYWKSIFSNPTDNKYVPRTILVDLEPTVIDQIRIGECYRNLFPTSSLLTGKEDAANLYARGYHAAGKQILMRTLEALRKKLEDCNNIQGIVFCHSCGGGTGSGFTTKLMEQWRDTHGTKVPIIQFAILPAPKIAHVVEPYNAVFTMANTMEIGEKCCILFDNQALYDICSHSMQVDSPSYSNLNRLIAQVTSSTICSVRFPGTLNVDLSEFQTNLVPFPRMSYIQPSLAPIVPRASAEHERLSVEEITKACFESRSQLLKTDQREMGAKAKPGLADSQKNIKMMSCCLMYRGQVLHCQATAAIQRVQVDPRFQRVSWCPTTFKVGLVNQPPIVVPTENMAQTRRSLCTLANSTRVVHAIKPMLHNFNLLLNKRAFVHHYVGEGMEEGEFFEARENLAALEQEYIDQAKDRGLDSGEEEEEGW